MKKEISLEERKQIQLEMLEEIHVFCKSHEIRYSLAYGTLIGAIRHKGFIPWDDDVDIMMPLPDLLRFKKEFKSASIRYCDVDTEKHFDFGFSRIAHNRSYRKSGLIFKSYGIHIDLYIVISLSDSIEERHLFFEKARNIQNRRLFYLKWRNRLKNKLPICSIPGYDKSVKDYRNYMLSECPKYGSSNSFYVFSGALSQKEVERCTYNFNLFGGIVEVDFEGLKLKSIKNYHDFLTQYYGDYMQLPPEDQRHPYHGGHYYWKD